MKGWITSTGQQPYRSWAINNKDISLFLQPWWLDAVCGTGQWTGILISDADQKVHAAMPIHIRKKYGLNWILPPQLSPYTGPWILSSDAQNQNPSNARHRYWDLMAALISAIPKASMIILHLDPAISDHLPFHWKKFRQTSRYSFRLPFTAMSSAFLFDSFKSSIRNEIRQAEESLQCFPNHDFAEHLDIYDKTFSRKNSSFPMDRGKLLNVLESAKKNLAMEAWTVADQSGSHIAAAVVFKDATTAYLSLSGSVDGAHRGAISYLYWAIIQYCQEHKLNLDFEGSMIPAVARVFSSFGTAIISHHRVFKGDLFYQLLGIR